MGCTILCSKILIVEDERIEAMNFKKFLIALGYDVVGIVSTGKDAINKVAEFKPDLILMDIILKGDMDGIETVEKIKEESNIPVIYITANHDENIISRAKNTSPLGYLLKPVNKTILKNTIELALHKQELENKLKESEEKYRTIFENTGYITVLLDYDRNILDINSTGEKLSGYSRDELIGKKWSDFIVKEEYENVNDYFNKMMKNPNLINGNQLETRIKDKWGNEKNVIITLGKIPDKKIYTSSILDITQHKKAEDELKKIDKRYRDLVDYSIVPVYETKIDGGIVFANEAMVKMFDFSSVNELKLVNIAQLYKNSTDRDKLINKIKKDKIITQYEVELVTKTGKTLNVLINANLTDNNLSGTLMDITKRKKAEKKVRENEQFLENIIENIPDMIFVKNADELKFHKVNKATEKIWGYNRDELIGRTDYDFFTKYEADFYTKNDKEVLNKKELRDIPEETIHTKYMGERILHTKKIPLLDEKGHSKYLLGISEDITERKFAEKELKKSLNEKEVLLKEIHHRVKNNLQIISSLLNLQEDYVKKDPTAINVLHESQNRVLSMAMIHEMLYLSKDLSQINFSDYINNLISNLLYSYSAEKTITPLLKIEEIHLNIETSIPCGLIINELVTNSLKYAFPNKTGELTISLNSYNDEYKLIISDNGVGFQEDYKNLNTSLGLKLVNSLIQQLDGSINLDKTQGTKYTIKFKELKYKERIKNSN